MFTCHESKQISKIAEHVQVEHVQIEHVQIEHVQIEHVQLSYLPSPNGRFVSTAVDLDPLKRLWFRLSLGTLLYDVPNGYNVNM